MSDRRTAGVGKTTLLKRVCDAVEDKGWQCQGFYTEELREEGQRVGFDVVTLEGNRGPLASVVDRDSQGHSGRIYKVGRYNIMLQSFEQIALPALRVKQKECTRLVVIDEIGKMELFSQSFRQTVKELLEHPKLTVFATIPAPGRANPFVEDIRHRDDVTIYTVTKENRHQLVSEVTSAVIDSLETYGT